MSSLISKVKDKLHVGKDKDHISTATSPKHGTSTTTAQQSAAAGGHTATPTTGTTTGGSHTTAPASGTSAGSTAGHPTASAAGQTTSSTTGGATRGAGPGGVTVAGQQKAPQETVVVHEHDPNWGRARDLTTGAEQASKVSAAKAYEAESHLITAQDAHKAAQDAATRQAHLAAQAEAEKQNIGGADYVHKELDKYKNKVEEQEKIHIDINRDLEGARNLVAAKEGELGSVAPVVKQHQKEIDTLSGKLSGLQGAKGDLEGKHKEYSTALGKLRGQHGQYADEITRLEAEVEQLNLHANELEEQARGARASANDRLKQLEAAKAALNDISREADKTSKGLQNVQKDLSGYREKEADLSQRLAAAQAAAKDSADLAAAKEAELQLARQQLQGEEAKGEPIAQDIERYRKQVSEKEREYEEAMVSSKAAREAYERFSAQAAEAAREAAAATRTKDAKLESYQQLKSESQAAKEREYGLWEEAKKHGNLGDVNALQRLAEAEKNLTTTHGGVAQPIVVPDVGPKQPTTEGPKLHRSEHAKESNENTARENIRTTR